MTRDEAVSVIAQVCNKWTGTIVEGDLIKEAFLILTSEPVPPPEPPATPEKTPPPNRAARRKAGPTKSRRPPGK